MDTRAWKTTLFVLALILLADLFEGKSVCKNTVKNKRCKKRREWCYVPGLQQVMLEQCRMTCWLCNAPDCQEGQLITKGNECMDLECPSKCKKMVDSLSDELKEVKDDYNVLEEKYSALEEKHSALEERVLKLETVDKPTKKYIIVSSKVNWNTAKAQCQSMTQGSLAEAVTLSDHETLRKLLAASPHKSHCGNGFWVYAHENGSDHNGRIFTWLKSGNRVSPDRWMPGEPNNAVEKCVEYRHYSASAGFLLNDNSCANNNLCYVCEQPV